MRISWRQTTILFVLLVALDAVERLTVHPPNFTPLAATALFASFLFDSVLLAALVPIAALAASDFFLGAYDWRVMSVVYLSLAFPVLLRGYLRSRLSPIRVGSSALLSSVVFFLTTNFAVWAFAGMYTGDAKGLLQCYVAAVPFFKNTIAGDLVWSGVFFGSYALVKRLVGARLSVSQPIS
jgi:hypothetical protein